MTKRLARNLPEQVAQALGARIVSGNLAQGAQIVNEVQLGDEFGVSRTAVREAMKRLGAKGLVEIRPKLGTRVLPRSQWSILDTEVLKWQREAPPSLVTLLQQRETRVILELGAVALAAARRDDDDIERIMAAYHRMEVSVSDPEAYAVADAEFHSEILRAADNEYLDTMQALIATDLLSSIKVTNPDTQKNIRSLQFHLDVAERIVAGDAGDAGEAVKAMHMLLDHAGKRLRRAGERTPITN